MDHTPDIMKVMDRRLYAASQSGDVEGLEKLRQSDPNVLHGRTPAGNSALHIAAYHGHKEFVETSLRLWKENPEEGIDFVRERNREGNTVLHEAAKGGHDDVVKYLLEECADLASQLNDDGESALFKAAEEGHVKPLETLLKVTPTEDVYYKRRSDGQTALHRAVARLKTGSIRKRHDQMHVIEKLLKERPQLANQSDIHFRTPLHFAGLVSNFGGRVAKLLIGKDMDLKPDIPLCYKVDKNIQSALHTAARQGNVGVVKEILNYSEDCIEMVDKDGKNALHLAVENAPQIYKRVGKSLKDIISSLIVPRLINCADKSGKTALDIVKEQAGKDPASEEHKKDPASEDLALFDAIILYLERQGAAPYILEDKPRDFNPTLFFDSSMLSVSASLMATVAFAAAFTLPGSLDTKDPPSSVLINHYLFKAFVIFDTLAFIYSLVSAILLIFAGHDRSINYRIGVSVRAAGLSLALAFGSAIHLVVAPKCLWLAVIVWVIVCFLPLHIIQEHFSGKFFMFRGPKRFVLGPALVTIIAVFLFLLESVVTILKGLPCLLLVAISLAIDSVWCRVKCCQFKRCFILTKRYVDQALNYFLKPVDYIHCHI